MIRMFDEDLARTFNDLDNRLPKSRGRCFDVGTWGGCGISCPVFLDGECEKEIALEIIENEKQNILLNLHEVEIESLEKYYDLKII